MSGINNIRNSSQSILPLEQVESLKNTRIKSTPKSFDYSILNISTLRESKLQQPKLQEIELFLIEFEALHKALLENNKSHSKKNSSGAQVSDSQSSSVITSLSGTEDEIKESLKDYQIAISNLAKKYSRSFNDIQEFYFYLAYACLYSSDSHNLPLLLNLVNNKLSSPTSDTTNATENSANNKSSLSTAGNKDLSKKVNDNQSSFTSTEIKNSPTAGDAENPGNDKPILPNTCNINLSKRYKGIILYCNMIKYLTDLIKQNFKYHVISFHSIKADEHAVENNLLNINEEVRNYSSQIEQVVKILDEKRQIKGGEENTKQILRELINNFTETPFTIKKYKGRINYKVNTVHNITRGNITTNILFNTTMMAEASSRALYTPDSIHAAVVIDNAFSSVAAIFLAMGFLIDKGLGRVEGYLLETSKTLLVFLLDQYVNLGGKLSESEKSEYGKFFNMQRMGAWIAPIKKHLKTKEYEEFEKLTKKTDPITQADQISRFVNQNSFTQKNNQSNLDTQPNFIDHTANLKIIFKDCLKSIKYVEWLKKYLEKLEITIKNQTAKEGEELPNDLYSYCSNIVFKISYPKYKEKSSAKHIEEGKVRGNVITHLLNLYNYYKNTEIKESDQERNAVNSTTESMNSAQSENPLEIIKDLINKFIESGIRNNEIVKDYTTIDSFPMLFDRIKEIKIQNKFDFLTEWQSILLGILLNKKLTKSQQENILQYIDEEFKLEKNGVFANLRIKEPTATRTYKNYLTSLELPHAGLSAVGNSIADNPELAVRETGNTINSISNTTVPGMSNWAVQNYMNIGNTTAFYSARRAFDLSCTIFKSEDFYHFPKPRDTTLAVNEEKSASHDNTNDALNDENSNTEAFADLNIKSFREKVLNDIKESNIFKNDKDPLKELRIIRDSNPSLLYIILTTSYNNKSLLEFILEKILQTKNKGVLLGQIRNEEYRLSKIRDLFELFCVSYKAFYEGCKEKEAKDSLIDLPMSEFIRKVNSKEPKTAKEAQWHLLHLLATATIDNNEERRVEKIKYLTNSLQRAQNDNTSYWQCLFKVEKSLLGELAMIATLAMIPVAIRGVVLFINFLSLGFVGLLGIVNTLGILTAREAMRNHDITEEIFNTSLPVLDSVNKAHINFETKELKHSISNRSDGSSNIAGNKINTNSLAKNINHSFSNIYNVTEECNYKGNENVEIATAKTASNSNTNSFSFEYTEKKIAIQISKQVVYEGITGIIKLEKSQALRRDADKNFNKIKIDKLYSRINDELKSHLENNYKKDIYEDASYIERLEKLGFAFSIDNIKKGCLIVDEAIANISDSSDKYLATRSIYRIAAIIKLANIKNPALKALLMTCFMNLVIGRWLDTSRKISLERSKIRRNKYYVFETAAGMYGAFAFFLNISGLEVGYRTMIGESNIVAGIFKDIGYRNEANTRSFQLVVEFLKILLKDIFDTSGKEIIEKLTDNMPRKELLNYILSDEYKKEQIKLIVESEPEAKLPDEDEVVKKDAQVFTILAKEYSNVGEVLSKLSDTFKFGEFLGMLFPKALEDEVSKIIKQLLTSSAGLMDFSTSRISDKRDERGNEFRRLILRLINQLDKKDEKVKCRKFYHKQGIYLWEIPSWPELMTQA